MVLEKIETYQNVFVVRHPLLQHKLSLLRDKRTATKSFQELLKEITVLLVYEATKDLPIHFKSVETPIETFDAPLLKGKKQVILPILRAGIGMVDGFLALMPSARVGHIGLYRDEKTLQPHCYFFKVPEKAAERHFFICDPMLATGGSAIAAIDKIKSIGVKKITFVCLVAAPEGIQKVASAHPDVPVFCANIDRALNTKGYIVPGLGDAGDRLFGTK